MEKIISPCALVIFTNAASDYVQVEEVKADSNFPKKNNF